MAGPYYVYSGAAGAGTGADWTNAFTTLTAAFAVEVAGDTIYVAHDHAESTATTVTLASSGTLSNLTKIICVNRAGSVPPVSADRRATATVTTTGNTNITFTGSAHYDGIIFTAGNSSGTGNVNPGNSVSSFNRFDNCSMRCGSTGTASRINIGAGGAVVEWNNVTVSFAHIAQSIFPLSVFKWRNTASALLGTIPTSLFNPTASRGCVVECVGVDFSAAGAGKNIILNNDTSDAMLFRFLDCKLHASVIKQQAMAAAGSLEVDFIRCGSAGINYNVYRQRLAGILVDETTVVRTGGSVA